jgi:hypothetical protein
MVVKIVKEILRVDCLYGMGQDDDTRRILAAGSTLEGLQSKKDVEK